VPGNDVDLNVGALGNSTQQIMRARWAAVRFPCSGPRAALPLLTFAFFAERTRHQHELHGVWAGDVAVISKQPAASGLSTSRCKSRNRIARRAHGFHTNTNLDKTAASGVLEVN